MDEQHHGTRRAIEAQDDALSIVAKTLASMVAQNTNQTVPHVFGHGQGYQFYCKWPQVGGTVRVSIVSVEFQDGDEYTAAPLTDAAEELSNAMLSDPEPMTLSDAAAGLTDALRDLANGLRHLAAAVRERRL
jgi:hypothetical protein